MVLTSCRSLPESQNESTDVIFPDLPSQFDDDGNLIVSLEVTDEDGNTFRTQDTTLKNVKINNVICPFWYWKKLVSFMIDYQAAKERLYGEEE